MISQFLNENTYPNAGAMIPVVRLRKRFEAMHGSVNRSSFIAALARAGATIAA